MNHRGSKFRLKKKKSSQTSIIKEFIALLLRFFFNPKNKSKKTNTGANVDDTGLWTFAVEVSSSGELSGV